MRARTILDCERDLKGIHEPVWISFDEFWCHQCGALLEEQYDKKGNPKGGLSRFKTLRRVQE